MFRTKSLSSKEMCNLIEKHQTKRMKKQNQHASLRSLIADKTMQYQKHMQNLVLQENNFNFSGKKSASKSRSNQKSLNISEQPEKASVQQFTPFDETIIDELKESIDSDSSQFSSHKPQASPYAYNSDDKSKDEGKNEEILMLSQKLKNVENENQNLMNKIEQLQKKLQKQQLIDKECQNLKMRIEQLQQKLQTSQLTQKQKQSQVDSLKITIKMLELRIQEQQEKQRQKLGRKQFFKTIRFQEIFYIPVNKQFCSIQIQSQMKYKDIDALETQLQQINHMYEQRQSQIKMIQQFIEQKFNTREEKNVNNSDSQQIYGKTLRTLQNFEQYRSEIQQMHQKQKQQLEQKLLSMKKTSDGKIKQLYQMLQLAQKQIRQLLKKLREQKQACLANYKTKLEQQLAHNITGDSL